jgi:hypothetical protein
VKGQAKARCKTLLAATQQGPWPPAIEAPRPASAAYCIFLQGSSISLPSPLDPCRRDLISSHGLSSQPSEKAAISIDRRVDVVLTNVLTPARFIEGAVSRLAQALAVAFAAFCKISVDISTDVACNC